VKRAGSRELETIVTAHHEAGHAWGYYLHHKPFRYATVRPRQVTGVCRSWKPRRMDISVFAWIASSGPIAEAIFVQAASTDPTSDLYDEWADGFDWDDYLTGAVLAGGHDDLANSLGMLDSPSVVAAIREQLEGAWVGISALANKLVSDQTVSGRDAWRLLTPGPDQSSAAATADTEQEE
jgi:hypothetical protein